jgi:hypothetical protein
MYPVKQSTALTVPVFAHDANGDAVTGLVDAGFTKRISKNGAAFAAMTVTITEMENGWYSVPLSTTHTNTTGVLSITLTHASCKQINIQLRVHANLLDDLSTATNLQTVDDNVDTLLTRIVGTLAAGTHNPQTGDSYARLGAPAGASVSADILVIDNFVDDLESRLTAARAGYLDNLNGHTPQTGDNYARLGAPAAASIAADIANVQSDTDDIQTRTPTVVTGTADSGSTTTMVDAARTEGDTDYWKGSFIQFTTGNIANQVRLITAFDPATDTITFTPPTTQAVGTNGYKILPNGFVLGLAAGSVTAAVVATGAVDADALATDAVNEIRDAILSDSTPFAGANIDAATSSRATPAQVNAEVLDVMNVDTFTEPGSGAPGVNISIFAKINYLYKAWRNRKVQDATTWELYDDAGTTVHQKATLSDDGTDFEKAEIVSGP